ncbi:hypothetical protein PG993_001086 [Apiospora rasikravindrae]|uniref:Uncharacterized protein n=1 Tax=Apiospora rasikravindrae TaxID=990691 RepID=A0ABR1UAC8_9PEZI
MDDATTLASDLLQKLGDLEQKVQDHRQEMATEFQRYSRSLLENATDHVSVQVEHAIRDSLHNYPAISSAFDQANPIKNNTTCRVHDSKSAASADRSKRNKGSPPPILPHTSGTPAPDESPRSPHAREREFHGLFTPSYLTLLGAENSNSRDTLSPPTSPPALPHSPQIRESATPSPTKAEQNSAPSLAAVIDTRPTPSRRPTQDTISSNTSDDSSGRNRRSALRRSSSSSTSKTQSPRRVRFEVEGGEVLPTMSPPTSPRFVEHLPSPLGITEFGNEAHNAGTIAEEDEDSVSLLGSSPPSLPKKVSSTDRLKALARTSDEDTSQWAVVGDSQDADDDDDMLVMGGLKPRPAKSQHKTTSVGTGGYADQPHISQPTESGNTGGETEKKSVEQGEEIDEEEEDDDLLSMPALSSFKGRKKFSPLEPSPLSETVPKTPTPTITRQDSASSEPLVLHSDDHAEEEEMFDWDSDETEPTSRSKRNGNVKEPKKYLEEEEEEEVNGQEEASVEESENDKSPVTLFATSPAVSIQKPNSIATPQASTPSRTSAASIGSFRGRPFSMSSVKDSEVIRRASELGNMNSFVGSVDGRSGLDESSSYRPTRGQFSGTPKSFSERLMMEDLIEAHEGSADAKPGKSN